MTHFPAFHSLSEFIKGGPSDLTGFVDYKALLENLQALELNVQLIEEAELTRFSTEEKKCFLCNAYNILCINLTVQKLKKDPDWKGNTSICARYSFFMGTKVVVGGERWNLYDLENKVIRPLFASEPLVHMYLNCASLSCPQLCKIWMTPENKEEILGSLAVSFVNEQGGLQMEENKKCETTIDVQASAIFKWYKGDFKEIGGVEGIAKKYLKTKDWNDQVDRQFKVSFMSYDWRRNDIERARESGFSPSC